MTEEVTPELAIYRRYVELGRIESEAKAERENLKQNEIAFAMRDGQVFGENGKALKLTLEPRVDFDWLGAIIDKVIPEEKIKDYAKITWIPVLRNVKSDEDEDSRQSRLNRYRSRADDMFDALLAIHRTGEFDGLSALLDALSDPDPGPEVEQKVIREIVKRQKESAA